MASLKGFIACILVVYLSVILHRIILNPKISVISIDLDYISFVLLNIDYKSPYLYIVTLIVGFLVHYVYNLLFRPLNRVRLLGDVGYQKDGKFTMKEISNRVKHMRDVGEIPPVYPNGWYALIESWSVGLLETKTISALGQQFAVFRDENGEAHVLDAYCPHMGANLAVGGLVTGDCIQCPFHGWKFRGHDGKCMGIPYAEKIPEVAKVKSWTTVEINDWINIWYHAEGMEPYWQIPEIEDISSGKLQYNGRTEHHVNAHIEEIPENGADAAHLMKVHRPFVGAGYELDKIWSNYASWIYHKWDATWSQRPSPEDHVGCMEVTHDVKFFGYSLFKLFEIKVKALQLGPAVVHITMEGIFFKCVLQHMVVPMEPVVQKVVQTLYMHWAIPNIIGKIFLASDGIQVDRDMSIWNNKKFQSKPILSKSREDSLITKHRRWYSQFYSEHSPRLNFQKDTLDW
ncbi:cholesterol 7-desaturase nvd-like [Ruditapes philippinarum]|uniref:cholesterol 7-desaturase nvd-like n=1 Tax=Ruditapes philippinarum TaxID=129788 RepID=UPI00295B68CE|nr:cholesterol 7-desaturase nvd-like [Ruditapes philippinarum]